MPAPFSPTTLAELAGRLEQRRYAARRLASSVRADAAQALDDLDLSDVFDTDNPASGTNDVDRARALQLAQLTSNTAAAVEDALQRLAAGTYGTCEGCGRRIPLARLRAVPETRLCVGCKVNEGHSLALAG
jgi:RNA polymerase-binding transcription factor DksA